MKLNKSSFFLLALIIIIFISLYFSISYISHGQIGILIPFSKEEKAKILSPGFHIHLPFFTKVIKYPLEGMSLESGGAVTSKEGVTLQIPYKLGYGIDPNQIRDLLEVLSSKKQLTEYIRGIITENINALSKRTYLCSLLEEKFQQEIGAQLRCALLSKGFKLENFELGRIELSDELKPIYQKSIVYRDMQPTNLKVLFIGVDGADWKIINSLIAKGKLPNFKKLKSRGAWGYLHTIRPILSPLIWTTMITGKSPEIHGIVDFVVGDPETDKQMPITNRSRKVKAIWNILFDFNRSCNIVNWLASWPAETVKGKIITDRVHYSLRKYSQPSEDDIGKTFPPELTERIKPLILKEEDISKEELSKFIHASEQEFGASLRKDVGDSRIAHFRTILASTLTYHRIALKLLEEEQPSFFAIYYPCVDSAGHLFIKEMPPRLPGVSSEDFAKFKDVVINVYQLQDRLIGDYLKIIEPNTIVIIASDHGFISGVEREPVVFRKQDIWAEGFHKINGILVIYGNHIKSGQLNTKNIFDIAPTILYLLGFPLPNDMPGKPITEPLDAEFVRRFAPKRFDSYEVIRPIVQKRGLLASADEEKILENLKALGYIGSSTASFTTHSNLGSIYFHKQQYHLAEREFKEALKIHPDNIPTMVRLILVYDKLGNIDKAIELHNKILTTEEEPQPEIYLLGVKLHLLKGDINTAKNILEGADEKLLKSKELKTAQGLIKQYQHDLSAAEQNFLDALKIDPLYYEPAEKLVEIYLTTEEFKKGEAILANALKLKADSYYHYNLLGTLYYRKGAFEKAEQAFKQALQFSPDFLQAQISLGKCYFKQNKTPQAIIILEKALKNSPDNYDILVSLGACLIKSRDYDKAIEHLNKALAIGPKTIYLYNALGEAYFNKKDYRASEEMLKQSLALEENQPMVKKMLQRISEAKTQSLP